jgi:hypothetical protein
LIPVKGFEGGVVRVLLWEFRLVKRLNTLVERRADETGLYEAIAALVGEVREVLSLAFRAGLEAF